MSLLRLLAQRLTPGVVRQPHTAILHVGGATNMAPATATQVADGNAAMDATCTMLCTTTTEATDAVTAMPLRRLFSNSVWTLTRGIASKFIKQSQQYNSTTTPGATAINSTVVAVSPYTLATALSMLINATSRAELQNQTSAVIHVSPPVDHWWRFWFGTMNNYYGWGDVAATTTTITRMMDTSSNAIGVWLIKRTFQPSIIRKKRKMGFLVRQRTVGGRRTLARRRLKGRARLGGGI